jgi:carboxyl-terminal processing protease
VKAVGYLFLTLAVISVAFLTGFTWRDLWAHRAPSVTALKTLVDPKLAAVKSPTEIFQDQYDHILAASAVDISPEKLKYAGMAGMFSALGDPHTNFLERDEADSLKLETRGDFVGIGARLSGDPAGARVAVVFKNSPADRAGVQAGDTIVEVDGKSTAGMDTNDIVSRIRGKEGTTVRIKAVRASAKSPLNFTIRRDVVILPSAEGRMLAGTKVGYVNISGFAQPTTQQLDQALDDLLAQKPTGLVLDLRGNPGGLLDAAVSMLGRFVDGKAAVKTRRRYGSEQILVTPVGYKKDITVPIVILVNEDSASAAEIFSGVMQEYRRATLVGEHTYGKSSVQNVINLVDLSSAKITIAKYFLPSGADIGRKLNEDGEYQSGGLRPDVEVSPNYDEDTVVGEPDKDSQLRKALEVIKLKTVGKN